MVAQRAEAPGELPAHSNPRPARPQFLYGWFTFAVASVLLSGDCLLAIRTLRHSTQPYRVFGSFWISGWAASHHLNPYAFYPLTWHVYPYLHDRGPLMYDVNLSPPSMLPLFQLAAHFSISDGFVVWSILSLLLFVSGSGVLLTALCGKMQKRQIVWLLLSTCVTDTLWFGQDYSLMFFLACLIWLVLRSEKTTAAAVCIGVLIAMKPNFGLWPIMLFIAGYKRPAIISAITGVMLSVLPLFIYGPAVYLQWREANAMVHHSIFTSDLSIVGVFTRLGWHYTGYIFSVACCLALILFVRRNRPHQVDLAGIAICAGILCAPLAWHHYVLFAAPFFAASRKWNTLQTCAAFLMALPSVLTVDGDPLWGLLVTLPHLAGLGIMLASFMRPELGARLQNESELTGPAGIGRSGSVGVYG